MRKKMANFSEINGQITRKKLSIKNRIFFLKSFKKEIHEKNWTSLQGKNSKFSIKMFMKNNR